MKMFIHCYITICCNKKIINFYGNLIMERSKDVKNKYPPVYFFNTFFFSTLCELGYRGVRRWTRRVIIKKKKKFFFNLCTYIFYLIYIYKN